MTGEVMPIGKHKGEPVVAVLETDREYCEWLAAQPWFREKYGTTYNVLVNYGGEPQDSPEHNQMQARFLEDGPCLALARVLVGDQWIDDAKALAEAREFASELPGVLHSRVGIRKKLSPAVESRIFENQGWDITYAVTQAVVRIGAEPPPCSCQCIDHSECSEHATCRGGSGEELWSPYVSGREAYMREVRCLHHTHPRDRARGMTPPEKKTFHGCWDPAQRRYAHCTSTCPWADEHTAKLIGQLWGGESFGSGWQEKFHVECKPDLGDDYPNVLRQVGRYPAQTYDRRCVLVRRAAFEHVAWEQVRAIFAASNVHLICETELVG